MSQPSLSSSYWSQREGVTVWTPESIQNISKKYAHIVQNTIDTLGQKSAGAQGLSHPITSTTRLKMAAEHTRLYVAAYDGQAVGILKVGQKRLYVRTRDLDLREIEPLCVLDFYVSQDRQRSGIGKELFDYMLNDENVWAQRLAYDRPSTKLMQFLRRHYHLENYVVQNNNFVLFDEYWDEIPEDITPGNNDAADPGRHHRGAHFMTSYNMAFSAPAQEPKAKSTSRTTIL